MLNQLDLVNNRSDQMKLFIYSLLTWTSVFLVVNAKFQIKNLGKKSQDDIKNRIISILHGLFTFWTATGIIFTNYPSLSDINSQAMQFTMIVSAAYFVYDLVACIHYDLVDNALVAHHTMAVSAYVTAIFSTYGGPLSIYGLACAEVSNFPMHMRCIMRSFNLKYTSLYEIFEIVYFSLYIIFRGMFVPVLVFHAITVPVIPVLVKIGGLGILLQSGYFICEMKSIIKRLMRNYKERQSKGIKYDFITVNPRVKELSYAQRQQRDKVF